MINLLPAEVKEQIRYAKLSRLVLTYVRITVAVVLVLAGIFAWAMIQVQTQAADVAGSVADKQKAVDNLKNKVLPKAQDASDKLAAIKYVQSTQTRFSVLISDIAKVVPSGVSIDSLTLTGDDKKPVRIAISTMTYDEVLAFQKAVITSPRVAGADIESITQMNPPHDGYGFTGSVVVGFKPGQAR